MGTVCSFPPIAPPTPRVLILGSIPGQRSLQEGQYYAHPQNAFWPILGAFCGFPTGCNYGVRVLSLCERGIAVWDVLQSCERAGSLDAAIVRASARPNDVAGFLRGHSAIRAVLCNGTVAWNAFQQWIVPSLTARGFCVKHERLPSTSPAHTMARTLKAQAWHEALERSLDR